MQGWRNRGILTTGVHHEIMRLSKSFLVVAVSAALCGAMAEGMAYDDPEAKTMFDAATRDGGAPILGMTIVSDLLVRPN